MAIEYVRFTPSRNISQITYDADLQEMVISFRSGAVYRYSEVPGDVAAGFSQSLSANDYLKAFVESSFRYERIV